MKQASAVLEVIPSQVLAFATLILAAAALMACMQAFQHTSRSAVLSSETRIVETSKSGMDIVPASCASDPAWYHNTLPETADLKGYKSDTGTTEYGNTKNWGAGPVFTCVTNTSGSSYFIPANSPTEMFSFNALSNTVSGLTVYGSTPPGVVSLLHMDGTNNSTTFTDSAPSPRTYTASSAVISTAQSKFGGASGYFNGAASLTTPDGYRFEFAKGPFTIELWAYPTSVTGTHALVGKTDPVGFSPYLIYQSGANLYFYASSVGGAWDVCNATSIGTVALNTWVHIAVVRSGSTFYTFKNGVLQGTCSSSSELWNNSYPFTIGSGGGPYFNGYIDEVRVSKDIARWTSNFTPPTSAY